MADPTPKTPKNHLISRRKVHKFIASHPGTEQDRGCLIGACKLIEDADWRMFADVRATFKNADQVKQYIVINVGSGKFRYVLEVLYRPDEAATVLLRFVYTHREYSKIKF